RKPVQRMQEIADKRQVNAIGLDDQAQRAPQNGEHDGVRQTQPACQRWHKTGNRQQPGQCKYEVLDFHARTYSGTAETNYTRICFYADRYFGVGKKKGASSRSTLNIRFKGEGKEEKQKRTDSNMCQGQG